MWSRLFRKSALPAVVAIGGGTGLATMLRGFKLHTDRITAIVSVGDDGGSSGRLRQEFGIVPPGDIRNCLVALAEAGPTMEALLQYRFPGNGELSGHAFGNLLLAALTDLTGDIRKALAEATRILAVRGRVLPACEAKVSLVAVHADGTKSTGEVAIAEANKPIERLELKPTPPAVAADIVEALSDADLIVLGPGSLFTSVLPPLLVPGMAAAIMAARAPVAYVCNIMTQPGETEGFRAGDHVRVLETHTRPGLIDYAVVNTGQVGPRAMRHYAISGQALVELEPPEQWPSQATVHAASLVSRATQSIRHDPGAVAVTLLDLARRHDRPRRRQ